jgi:hypothetical protein
MNGYVKMWKIEGLKNGMRLNCMNKNMEYLIWDIKL